MMKAGKNDLCLKCHQSIAAALFKIQLILLHKLLSSKVAKRIFIPPLSANQL